MKQRWLVVAFGLPALLAVLLLCPSWAAMLLVCGISGVAAYELLRTAGKDIPHAIYVLTITSAVLQMYILFNHVRPASTLPHPATYYLELFELPWILVVALFFTAVKTYGGEKAFSFHNVAICIVGGYVFPMMYSCIFQLRMQEFGKMYVLAPFFIAFAGDAMSMYFGMWFGKRKMAPHVSPHKTWAGGVGGPIGSALAMCVLGVIGGRYFGYAPNYPALICVGCTANVFGQLGDLSMSLIKREAGLKDYSHLFLTHGGMLDRFDSSMFIAPVVLFFVTGGFI